MRFSWTRSCVASLALSLVCRTSLVDAHPIIPDGNAVEWIVRSPPAPDQALVIRDRDEPGEWVWTDRVGDARGGVGADDLTQVRVHANLDGLGFFLRFAALPSACVQAQIALDIDRVANSGALTFVNAPNTALSSRANAEAIIVATPRGALVYRGVMAPIAAGAGVGPDGLETFVPWSALGVGGVVTGVRATVAVFCAPNGVNPQVPADGVPSEAVDVVSDYAGFSPVVRDTRDEVRDGVHDHFVQWYFGTNGGLIAPLGVQRVAPLVAMNHGGAWFDLRAFAREPISLDGYAFGDEAIPGGPDGLAGIPAGISLMPGQSITVALDGASFFAAYGTHATVDLAGTDPLSLPAIALPTRAQGAVAFSALGDEIVVVDSARTNVDVVTYGAGNYAQILPIPAIGADEIFNRLPNGFDIDDGRLDFIFNGAACGASFLCAEQECSTCSQRACLERPDGLRCTQRNGFCGTCFIGACGAPRVMNVCPVVPDVPAVVDAPVVLDAMRDVVDSGLDGVSPEFDASNGTDARPPLDVAAAMDSLSSDQSAPDVSTNDAQIADENVSVFDVPIRDDGGASIDAEVYYLDAILDRAADGSPLRDSADAMASADSADAPSFVATGGCQCSLVSRPWTRSATPRTLVVFAVLLSARLRSRRKRPHLR